MEDVVALFYLNRYMKEAVYETIILDCPPPESRSGS